MIFYWVRDIVIQGKFIVYLVSVEQNMEDYFINNHPEKHHFAIRNTYLVPTADTIKYFCYMAHNALQGCVESLYDWGNVQQTYRVSPPNIWKHSTVVQIVTVLLGTQDIGINI